MNTQFYRLGAKEVLNEFKTSPNFGLNNKQVNERLEKYGKNILTKKKPINKFKLFINQFTSPLVLILIFAVIISGLAGELTDVVVISVILIVNAILGFTQNYKAEKSIEALKDLASPESSVIREGHIERIKAELLVPGDIILLEPGTKVNGDSRIIESKNLEVQESVLTGESQSVFKYVKPISKESTIAEQKNMLFTGTTIVNGRGKAVVVRTGASTELGKITESVVKAGNKMTPLQQKLAKVGKVLGIIVIIISFVIFAAIILKDGLLPRILNFDLTLFQERAIINAFIVSIALAVAAVPEGLPAVVTTTLSLGVNRMVKKHVLIRKLASVETLGNVSVICSDKTGTITKGEMTVKKIFVDNKIIKVSNIGYSTDGKFSEKTKDLNFLLKLGLICNNASYDREKFNGSPTEVALLIAGLKYKLNKEELDNEFPRIKEIPFSSKNKFMLTINSYKRGKDILVMKGAPDIVLGKCSKILINGRIKKLDNKTRKEIYDINEKLSNEALRVLSVAYRIRKKNTNSKRKKNEPVDLSEFIFVGFEGIIDPPREDVKEAVNKCRLAGVRVIMITGDYRTTAMAIAKSVGIHGQVISGQELNGLNEREYEHVVERYNIYARVTPEHKFKILKALKKRGYSVAMTGDGVNDAPALKEADIGIAVNSGTDVAKEASDMVLLDNSFSSIVSAIEEGRRIYSNMKKFIRFLLSSNIAEVLVIFIAILMKLPLPLIAAQILWMNMLTDGLPALALSFEPLEPNSMLMKPRSKKENIINGKETLFIITIGSVMTFSTLFLFKSYLPGLDYARTMAFTGLVVFELVNALNSKSEVRSVFKTNFLSNKLLLYSLILSILLQIMVIYTPRLNVLFGTTPLAAIDLVSIFVLSIIIILTGEITKMINSIVWKE